MKKNVALLTLLALSVGAFGILQKHKEADIKTLAATPKTDIRVYVVRKWEGENRWQFWEEKMYIHYWGGSSGSDYATAPEMVKVLDDYHHGLYYYDVPANTTHFMVSAFQNEGNNNLKSKNLELSEVLDKQSNNEMPFLYDWNGVDGGGGNRVFGFEKAGMSTSQLAKVLGHIDSCSSSYASGYNAYPQINNLFLSNSQYDPNTTIAEGHADPGYAEGGGVPVLPTIGAKLDYMKYRYNEDQGIGSGLNVDNNTSGLTATIIIGAIGITTLAGYYFITKKSKVIA